VDGGSLCVGWRVRVADAGDAWMAGVWVLGGGWMVGVGWRVTGGWREFVCWVAGAGGGYGWRVDGGWRVA